MNGKEVQLVSGKNTWKHIPIAIGGSAPKRFDLIEFEELSSYNLEDARKSKSTEENRRPTKAKKQSKRQRQREQLKAKIFEGTSEDKTDKSITSSKSSSTKSSTKKKLKKRHKHAKKIKFEEDNVVTSILNTTNNEKNESENIDHVNISSDIEDDMSLMANMPEWNGLHVPTPVLKALSELGFTSPMPIQKEVLPAAIVQKQDILGAAETGSGKTLAFGIPLIHHLLEDETKKSSTQCKDIEDTNADCEFDDDFDDTDLNALVSADIGKILSALILTPTRELAMQVTQHLKNVTKYTKLVVVPVVGGMAPQKQIRLLEMRPDIVVATPGRLWDFITDGRLPYLSRLHQLKYLVIDEADRMVERGHFLDLSKLLEAINSKETNVKRQTYVFSATLTSTHDTPARLKFLDEAPFLKKDQKLSELIKKIGVKRKNHVVDLTTNKLVAGSLNEGKIICGVDEKDFFLYYFLKAFPGKTLVFSNSIDCIFRLTAIFELLQCAPLHIHAKMQQRHRLKHLDRFQLRDNAIMFASDVAARGLDIPNVNHVIHYQTPRTIETYVHRSGRCARTGKKGYSLLLVSPQEMTLYKKLCCQLDRERGFPDLMMDLPYLKAIKQRVLMAREVDLMAHQQKKIEVNNNWYKQAADAMDIELDDELLLESSDSQYKSRELKDAKAGLKSLLSQSVFPKNYSAAVEMVHYTDEASDSSPFERPRNLKKKKRKLPVDGKPRGKGIVQQRPKGKKRKS